MLKRIGSFTMVTAGHLADVVHFLRLLQHLLGTLPSRGLVAKIGEVAPRRQADQAGEDSDTEQAEPDQALQQLPLARRRLTPLFQ